MLEQIAILQKGQVFKNHKDLCSFLNNDYDMAIKILS